MNLGEEGTELALFDTLDSLQACIADRDIQGALKRLDNMREMVRALEPERCFTLEELQREFESGWSEIVSARTGRRNAGREGDGQWITR